MKNNKFIALSAILAICFGITGCNNNNANDNDLEGDVVLNVYNCADYICETDEESGTIGVVEQFEQYCKDTYNVNVKVNYSTYETNEDMYNQLRAGGIQYDLICPSDYMIDKLIMNDMILPLTSQIENYENYGSKYIRTTFDEITSHTSDGQEVKFKDYAIPYMWGTMGFMYDPNPKGLKEGKDINEDVESWDIIWDKEYKNKTSLKDSIRDTYITGTLKVYKEELNFAKKMYDEGKITVKEYNDIITDVMNRCDDSTLTVVEAILKEAKENVYEFEVDTGKEHIIKGDYWVNLCWSGDAVYALDLADDEGFTLNYKVPKEGSNVWFDGWAMPKGANTLWAQRFMDFLCKPEIASQNMDSIGYTSAIAGQEIWDLVQDWYEAEDGEDATDYDLSYFFKDTGIEDEDGIALTSFVIHTAETDRQLYAQYPDEQTINRCAVMKDFGDQNDKVTEMWIRVKGNSSSWYIYVFLGVIVALVVFFEVKSAINRRARKNRGHHK